MGNLNKWVLAAVCVILGAIQAQAQLTPPGSNSSATKGGIQANSYTYCADTTSSTTTYACSLSPALASYSTGMVITFKPATTSTGASTINVNSNGAKSITSSVGGALVAGDLVAGVIYSLEYDGTNFRKIEANATVARQQAGAYLYCADAAGSATTYTCSLSPALTAYTTGMQLTFVPGTTNSGASTLNVNGLGAKSIIVANATGSALVASDLISAGVYTLEYDGTNFRKVNGPDGAWTALAYTALADFGGGLQAGQYMKDRMGIVHLRGVVTCASSSTVGTGAVMFTLPAGFRVPAFMIATVNQSNTAINAYGMNTDGTSNPRVAWVCTAGTNFHDLDSITFSVY